MPMQPEPKTKDQKGESVGNPPLLKSPDMLLMIYRLLEVSLLLGNGSSPA